MDEISKHLWLTAVFSPPTMQLDILIFSQILDATMGSIERIPQVDIAILFRGNVFVLYVEVRMKLNWETNGNNFGELNCRNHMKSLK